MRWSPAVLVKLQALRDVRVRMAELQLAKTEADLTASRRAEAEAREQLEHAVQRSAQDTREARDKLLRGTAAGRSGISAWHQACRRARHAVDAAGTDLDDAVSRRIDIDMRCSHARERWRKARVDVERLRLLGEELSGNVD